MSEIVIPNAAVSFTASEETLSPVSIRIFTSPPSDEPQIEIGNGAATMQAHIIQCPYHVHCSLSLLTLPDLAVWEWSALLPLTRC